MHCYRFTKWINSSELTNLLKTYNLEPVYINTVEEEVFIYYGTALTGTQEIELQAAVAAHEPSKPTIPRAVTPRQIRMALQAFNERYGNIRQDLALKKVRGEHLSNFESLQLASLNSRLKNLLSTTGENRHIATLEKFLQETESL